MLLKGLHAKDIYLAIVLIMLFKENSDSWDINFGIQPVELSSFNYYCVYPGDQLTLDCTVQGGSATLWKGSTFDCSINLLHSRFNSQQNQAGGECNNGKIVAHSIGGLNGTFISQLNVTVTKDMNNNTTIMCAVLYPNGTENATVQNTLIIVDAVTAGLGSPGNIHLIAVDNNYLPLQRSEDSAIHDMHMCSSFFIYSNHCGKCLNVTTVTSASCEILNKDTVSTFLIQNEVCEKLDRSIESLEVFLSIPNPPNFKTSAQNDDGNLISIQTSFVYNVSEIFNTSDGIDSTPISFTIIYSDSTTGVICGSNTIPAMSCGWNTLSRLCTDVFNVQASSCPPSTDINVSIFVTNVLGNGPTSDYVAIDARKNITVNGGADQGSTGQSSDLAVIIVVIILSCIAALAIILSTVLLIVMRRSKTSCIWKQLHTRDIDVATTEGELPAVYSASFKTIISNSHDQQQTLEQCTLKENIIPPQGSIYTDVCLKAKSDSVHLGAQDILNLDDKVQYAELKHLVSTVVHDKQDTRQHHNEQLDRNINLDMLLIQLKPQVTPKWYQFGVATGISKEVMDNYSDHPDEECFVEVLDHWLRNHKSKPSWKEVAEVLREIDLHQLADDLMKSYETGQLPIQIDMNDSL